MLRAVSSAVSAETSVTATLAPDRASVLFGKFANYQRAAQGLWQGAVRREWPSPCQEPQRGHRPCAARPPGARRSANYDVVSLGNIDILPAEHALYLATLRALIVNELPTQDTSSAPVQLDASWEASF